MSRIGRLPIPVPDGVAVTLDGDTITVTGPRGALDAPAPPDMRVVQEDGALRVDATDEQKRPRSSTA